MDNKELISRLVNFDDDIDTSTGFTSVSGTTKGVVLYVPFLKVLDWVRRNLEIDTLYVTPGGMKGMGEHVTYIGMEFPYQLNHIDKYVTMKVETDVLLYSENGDVTGKKIILYDDIVRNIESIKEHDVVNHYLGTDMWTDDYKDFVECQYSPEVRDTPTKMWNLMRSVYQTNYNYMKDAVCHHKWMLLSHVEKYIRPLCETMTETERDELIEANERFR